MYFKKIVRCTATIVSALMLVIASPAALTDLNVRAATQSELEAQSQRLKEKAKSYQNEINNQEKNKGNQQAYVDSINGKIDIIKQQIELRNNQIQSMNKKIDTLKKEISQKEQETAEKEAAISKRFEELRYRLRAISKSGNMSTFQMLMDTENYTDYLIKSKIVERVAKNDQELMDELENELQVINKEKEKLDDDKQSVASQRSKLIDLKKEDDAQKAELDVLYGKANAALKQTQGNINNFTKKRNDAEAQAAKIDKEITRIINSQNNSNIHYDGNEKYGGGTMYWPVPAVHNISSPYGYRWGRLHRGIDIANGSVPIYGKNIVAASDGVVIYANKTSNWGGGYGYYLIIDHGRDNKGRKIATLYAHCSKVLVSVGQHVKGGQTVVARAGSSGHVTGPHLHFEVRVNGTAVDPLKNGFLKLN